MDEKNEENQAVTFQPGSYCILEQDLELGKHCVDG